MFDILWSLPAVLNGPRAHFLFSGGEVAGEAERLVPGVDDAQQAAFLNAVRAEHFALLFVGKPLQFFFNTGADFDDFDVARGGELAEAGHMGIVLGKAVLVHVGAVDDLFGGQKAEFMPRGGEGRAVLGFKGGSRIAVVEVLQKAGHFVGGHAGILVALGHLDHALVALGCALNISEQEFGFNGFDVAQRIDRTVHMGDVVVLKAAHNLKDGGAFADVAEELVAEAFALAGPAHEPGDVDEVHGGINRFLRVHQIDKRVDAAVGHGNRGLVGLDGAEGVVRGLRVLCLGQRVEKGGLAHVGKADDADAQCHE